MKLETRNLKLVWAALVAASLCLTASAATISPKAYDVSTAPNKRIDIEFFQAESIDYLQPFKNGRSIYVLSTNNVFVWEIRGWIDNADYTNTYAVTTGTVADAESGTLSFSLTADQANLPEGTYLGFVKALHPDGKRDVLASQQIKVEWSEWSLNYALVEPIAMPFYTQAEIDAITAILSNQTAAVASDLSDISGIVSTNQSAITNLQSSMSTAQADISVMQTGKVDAVDFQNFETNPPATGPEGSFQYNSGGHLAGFTNIWYDAGVGKVAIKAGENVFRLYNGITNAADATDSNLIFRLSNQSGVSQIEMGEDGDIGVLIRGDGSIRSSSIDLGGVTRTNWYDYAALDAYIITASNLFVGLSSQVTGKVSQTDAVYTSTVAKAASALQSFTEADPVAIPRVSALETNAMLKSVYAPQNGLLKFFLDGYEQWGIGVDGFGGSPYLWRQNDTPTVTKFTLWSDNNFDPSTKADSNTVSGLASGTDAFDGILLDSKIEAWSDIGVTYSNAVRINNPVTITNDSAWTGWTTTGSLTASNEVLLLTGQYLLSPEQSNGVARFEVNSSSSQNGTAETIKLLSGTNEVAYPYYAQDAQLKIIAGDPLPGATAGLYVSSVTLVGYENLTEAETAKYVAGLRRTDAETHADDMTSKRYVDSSQTAAEKHADSGIATYAADPSKKLIGDRLELGNFTLIGSGAWQGANFTQSADRATIGTRLDDDIITLDSGLAAVEIQDVTQIGTNVTLLIYAQNIIGDPTIGVTTNLMVAFVPIAATITDLGGGNYSAVVDVSGLGSSTGFFRAYGTAAPASAGSVTINADLLNLDGHTITNVAEIVFTNGWKIACTTNGLEFIEP